MATYGEIQDRVRVNIIDIPANVLAAIPAFVNNAITNLQQKHDFKVQEALAGPYITATHTRVLATAPSNFLKPRGKPYIVGARGEVEMLAWAPNRVAVSVEHGSDLGGEADPEFIDGPPQNILIAELVGSTDLQTFEVWPFSDGLSQYTDGQYRIVIPYWKTLATLSLPSDANWFTQNASYYLELEATAMGFFMDWDEEKGTVWKQRAQEYLKDIIALDKKYRLGGVSTLVPHPDVFEARLLK